MKFTRLDDEYIRIWRDNWLIHKKYSIESLLGLNESPGVIPVDPNFDYLQVFKEFM